MGMRGGTDERTRPATDRLSGAQTFKTGWQRPTPLSLRLSSTGTFV